MYRVSQKEFYNLELFGRSHKSGESKNLLKTYTHRCEPSAPQKARNLAFSRKIFFKEFGLPRLSFGKPRNDKARGGYKKKK